MIKGKGPEEIRKTFNIKNDFTTQEVGSIPNSSAVVDLSTYRRFVHFSGGTNKKRKRMV